MMGAKTLEAQLADGTAKVQGDVNILKQLAATFVDFDPRFEIMPGTKAQVAQGSQSQRLRGHSAADHRRIKYIDWSALVGQSCAPDI